MRVRARARARAARARAARARVARARVVRARSARATRAARARGAGRVRVCVKGTEKGKGGREQPGGGHALGLLAILKETREVKRACRVEATSIKSVVNE